MKYYIIAGEASGDLHASNLVEEIKLLDAHAIFRGWGGDMMQQAGVHISKHIRMLAFMGFLEVAKNIRSVLKNIRACKNDIAEFKPDAVILIDYPGFNLRIAPFAKQAGCKVIYYISPQVWAWNSSRVKIIKRYIDKMLVILPFEKDFYAKYNYPVEFVGHPLMDVIKNKIGSPAFYKINSLSNEPIIGILPGSRKQEIAKNLPTMLSLARHFPKFQFVVACAPGIEKIFYEHYAREHNIFYLFNQTYDILQHSAAALVTSGTATLEAALFNIPQIVCYKGNIISYLIARRLIRIKYISLVNLIMNKEVVREFIQFTFNEKYLRPAFERLVFNDDYRTQILEDYSVLSERLGEQGASEKAANSIVEYLQAAAS